tara:strand:+ start:488 stop:643 length:156 start_codon:yes stop_codon:yes gene_type:complete
MKKLLTITTILLTLVGCGSSNYLPCPAYSQKQVEYSEQYVQNQCENCDEID